MNAYQSLNHPWITGDAQKTFLASGLTIKLSFKANQTMERLFSLLMIGQKLEEDQILIKEADFKAISETKKVNSCWSRRIRS